MEITKKLMHVNTNVAWWRVKLPKNFTSDERKKKFHDSLGRVKSSIFLIKGDAACDLQLINKWVPFILMLSTEHNMVTCCTSYCVKSVRIRSYSGPHFSAFGLNTAVQMQENEDQNNSQCVHNTYTVVLVLVVKDTHTENRGGSSLLNYGGPNSEIFLSDLRKLFQRVQFFVVSKS